MAVWTLEYTLSSLEKSENKKYALIVEVKEIEKCAKPFIEKMYFPIR